MVRSRIGGGWEIVTEISPFPEAGDHHQFLHRHSERVNVRVDADVYSYRFIQPDTVLWIGMDNRGLWIATGDHQPLLLQAGLDGWQVPTGDPLDLGLLGEHRLADLAQLAATQPLLTSHWKRPQYTYPNYPSSPTTLPSGGSG
jgi:hypothetical protein